jgi:hypothetical protein
MRSALRSAFGNRAIQRAGNGRRVRKAVQSAETQRRPANLNRVAGSTVSGETVLKVSAENAKRTATDFLSGIELPSDTNCGRFQLVTFENDEDCRFFYPRRAATWQQQVNTYISRALRRQGVRVHRVPINPTDYHGWRADRADTPSLRREFADQHLRFVRDSASTEEP